jgi:hypothetical protein
MPRLSITTAWNETAEIVKRDFGALFTIALALIALPSVAMQALGPAGAGAGQPPELGLWLLLVPVVLVLSIVGAVAISSLALGRENVVGSAIAHGFRRFLPLLGASLLIALGAVILLLPLVMLAGIGVEDLTQPTAATFGRLGLILLVYCLIVVAFWVRLMLMTPVAAAEPAGPIAIIRRSWALTGGHFWKLLGFVLLMIVVLLVVGMVVGMVFGILIAAIFGAPEPGSFGALVLLLIGAVVNAAFGVVLTAMIARIYVQLAGASTSGS